MASDAEYIADRSALRALWRDFPDMTIAEYARRTQRSESWARKWIRRFQADPDSPRVVLGLSRARKRPPPSVSPEVVTRILAIRDEPPDHLRRIPGPKAIAYFLSHEDFEPDAVVPTSSRTIWEILREHDRIAHPRRFSPAQLERPSPLDWWQIDFKDSRFVPPEPDGKQQHMVETLDIMDCGSDVLLCCEAGAEYNAETVFAPIVAPLHTNGNPGRNYH